MLTFSQFTEERNIDPLALASRVARRYGKRTSFGKWEKVERGGHIPLSTFNSGKSNAAGNALWKFQHKLGFDSRDKEERAAGRAKYDAAHETKTFPVDQLRASQPFVRTNDSDKLKDKIAERDPKHIHVITHKGIHYVADGHHAVMAARMRGEKEVKVSHIDLDRC